MDEFSRGEWVYCSEKTEKDFVCCTATTKNISVEIREICAQQKSDTGFCACDIRDETVLTINRREKWEWVPFKCEALKYTPDNLCALIGDKVILILGDSISYATKAGLAAYLQKTLCANNIRSGKWGMATRVPARNISSEGDYDAIQGLLGSYEYVDIVIMNFGAWYRNITMYEEGTTRLIKDITIARQSPMTRHMQYLWRSNTVPHMKCMDHHKPLSLFEWEHPPESVPDRFFSPVYQSLQYNWHLLPLFDEYSRVAMKKCHVPFMNIATPLSLRPDMHVSEKDCLHSCMPGALDHVFNRMLMHYLYYYDSYKYYEMNY